jgi:Raf kinase inhibitor-like YbhB/YbcL family protein
MASFRLKIQPSQYRSSVMTFALESPAFRPGSQIPPKHARSGENLSPPLSWRDAPAGTKSFVLIVEDPDAPSGTFRHWGLYNIEPGQSRLPEGAARSAAPGFSHAVNDFGNASYDGPQPPPGHGPHHYHFRLAALDAEKLPLPAKATVADLLDAARPHVVAEAELVGVFESR